MTNKALRDSAMIAVKDCMKVVKGEHFLVVTDPELMEIGSALFEAGLSLGAVTALMEITPLTRNGEEPPEMVSIAMTRAQAVLAPTSKSLTHTAARRNACAAGARVGTMPGITIDTMARCLNADYYAIADRTIKVTGLLTAAKVARITTDAGTDITMPLEGIKAIASTGLVHEAGSFGNLPSGEAYMMPVEGGSEGVFVVDGSMAGIGTLEGKPPIRIVVEKGFATKITGGPEADRLRAMLEPLGRAAFNTAELGIGTNDAARIIGNILEDEKVMGTIHIALGNNMSMGGTVDVPIHLDGIVKNPTVWLDGTKIMENGKLLVG
ncbi:MAG: aminopeptidase [Candidatus Krumholzibacteria bacterium]|jgi:leucyl aminopeptidase (aminopeptidase T)|nr:aminopeptidase [Candidatus Krumholzibacteria bacterium]